MKQELGICVVRFAAFVLIAARSCPAAGEENKAVPSVAGTWRWNFTMPDGSTVRPKLILTLEGEKVAGTTSFGSGTEASITNAAVNGDKLRFQVFRLRGEESFATTYTGTWSDKTIQGKIESNWAGKNQSFNWEARRANLGVEGVWRWTNSFFGGFGGGRGGRGSETRVELEQDGDKIAGKTVSRFGRPASVTNGSMTNGVVYFEIERTFGDNKFITKFRGKQSGDMIKGTVELEVGDDVREGEWEAKRAD